jgi:TatD DNase family protein
VIDTHCHLDRCDDLARALDNELRAMVTIGTDPARGREAVRLAEADARVFAAVGIHPNEASSARDPAARDAIDALAAHPRVVAIGETGFDDHWKDETLDEQRRAFDWHAELARAHGKPLILHVRDAQGGEAASQAAARALLDTPEPVGVLHCFGGHPDLLAAGLETGWKVSFAGNLTYKSAGRLREAARELASSMEME